MLERGGGGNIEFFYFFLASYTNIEKYLMLGAGGCSFKWDYTKGFYLFWRNVPPKKKEGGVISPPPPFPTHLAKNCTMKNSGQVLFSLPWWPTSTGKHVHARMHAYHTHTLQEHSHAKKACHLNHEDHIG